MRRKLHFVKVNLTHNMSLLIESSKMTLIKGLIITHAWVNDAHCSVSLYLSLFKVMCIKNINNFFFHII